MSALPVDSRTSTSAAAEVAGKPAARAVHTASTDEAARSTGGSASRASYGRDGNRQLIHYHVPARRRRAFAPVRWVGALPPAPLSSRADRPTVAR